MWRYTCAFCGKSHRYSRLQSKVRPRYCARCLRIKRGEEQMVRYFFCAECDMGKYLDTDGTFTVDDLFYCYKCENYTENRVE